MRGERDSQVFQALTENYATIHRWNITALNPSLVNPSLPNVLTGIVENIYAQDPVLNISIGSIPDLGITPDHLHQILTDGLYEQPVVFYIPGELAGQRHREPLGRLFKGSGEPNSSILANDKNLIRNRVTYFGWAVMEGAVHPSPRKYAPESGTFVHLNENAYLLGSHFASLVNERGQRLDSALESDEEPSWTELPGSMNSENGRTPYISYSPREGLLVYTGPDPEELLRNVTTRRIQLLNS